MANWHEGPTRDPLNLKATFVVCVTAEGLLNVRTTIPMPSRHPALMPVPLKLRMLEIFLPAACAGSEEMAHASNSAITQLLRRIPMTISYRHLSTIY